MKKLFLFLTGLLIFNSVFATTFTVSNLSDSGPGSLRQAIISANADATATVGSPHIIDATGVSGTINLATFLPDITKHTTINGPTSSTLTVNCNTITGFRLFAISSGITANVNNLTLTNGKGSWPGGGAFNNAGTLTITNCTISNCSLVTGDWVFGGGIYSTGTVTVTNSTITGGKAVHGGGLYIVSGTASINNSIISNNTTDAASGGGNGGGIFVAGGTVTINNSTINGNSTVGINNGGGIYATAGTVTITNSTISGNTSNNLGGGIYGSSNITIKNCTVSGNSAPSSAGGSGGGISGNVSVFNSTIVNNTSYNATGAGYNGSGQISNSIVVGNTSISTGLAADFSTNTISSTYGRNIFGGNPTVTGNKTNYTNAVITDILDPVLTNNGGPTKTHALIACSFAINNGTGSGSLATDQRGVSRTDSVDIGAYESAAGSNGKPFITTQPTGPIACSGASTSISIGATGGSGINYQWQVNPGTGTYSNISNGGIYSGATSSTLSISDVTGLQGYIYKCVVSSSACSSSPQISAEAPITVRSTPLITSEPQDFGICSGTNNSPPYTATGGGLTYQWQIDKGTGFTNVVNDSYHNGATSSYLNIGPGNAIMNGWKYRVIINNSCGPSDTSNYATLTFYTALSITGQPVNQTACTGTNTSFSVTSSGTGATYQWQLNSGSGFNNISDGGAYSNTTTSTLSITGVTGSMNNYQYRCVVKNPCNFTTGITSTAATLTVNGATITSQPQNKTICSGFNTSFSVTASASSSITYQWQVNNGGGFTDLTDNSVYSGTATSTLDVIDATTSLNGYLYRCILTTSTCTSSPVTSSSASLTVNPSPLIVDQPVSQTSWNNGSTTFTMSASGSGLSYKWQLKRPSDADFANINDGVAYNNTSTPSLTVITPSSSMNGYQYRCVLQSSTCPGNGLITDVVILTTSEIKICMVTVDDVTGKNMIVFEKPADLSTIQSFRIYREGDVTDQYNFIGGVFTNDLSTYTDMSSIPEEQPYLYKITVRNIYGEIFPLSSSLHKTMHLTVNKGTGNKWNLIWTSYEGMPVNTYKIYRGTSVDSLSLIKSVSGNITSYTDNSAPTDSSIYYQIEIDPAYSCTPSAKTSAFASVKSNKVEAQKVSVGVSSGNSKLEIYPNPAKETVTIKDLPANSHITIYDLSGRPVKSTIAETNSSLSVSELRNGMYILEVKADNATYRMTLTIE